MLHKAGFVCNPPAAALQNPGSDVFHQVCKAGGMLLPAANLNLQSAYNGCKM
jgi:hypothetical protein